MAPVKVTEMVLNVDLKCPGCYKKVKKVMSKIPQIRDQFFLEEKNKVKIVVVCCSPEKVRDKLCCNGGGTIQSIEIIEKIDKPKEDEKPKPKPKEGEKPKEAGPPKEAPKKAEAGPKPDAVKMVYEPVHRYPQMYPQFGYPMNGYGQYYDQGYGDALYQHGYAMQLAPPPPPPPTYGGFGYEHGYNRYNANKNNYMSYGYGDEEGCPIM